MATVIFSSELQRFTGEEQTLVAAGNYEELIRELLGRYEKLPEQEIRKMAVAIDGEIIHDPGYERIPDDGEIHFLYRISGG